MALFKNRMVAALVLAVSVLFVPEFAVAGGDVEKAAKKIGRFFEKVAEEVFEELEDVIVDVIVEEILFAIFSGSASSSASVSVAPESAPAAAESIATPVPSSPPTIPIRIVAARLAADGRPDGYFIAPEEVTMEHGREALVDQGFVAPQGDQGASVLLLEVEAPSVEEAQALSWERYFLRDADAQAVETAIEAAGFVRATIPAKTASPADTAASEAPQVRTLPSGPFVVSLNGGTPESYVDVFHDPDGDPLTLTAKSEDEAIFSVAGIDGFIVTLQGKAVGTAFVTVTATDPSGKNVWVSTRVRVLPAGMRSMSSPIPGFEASPELALYGLRIHLEAGIPASAVPERFLVVMGIVVNDASEAEAIYEQCFVEALEFPAIETMIGGLVSMGVVQPASESEPYSLTETGRAVLAMLDAADTIAHDRRLAQIRAAARECPALNGYST